MKAFCLSEKSKNVTHLWDQQIRSKQLSGLLTKIWKISYLTLSRKETIPPVSVKPQMETTKVNTNPELNHQLTIPTLRIKIIPGKWMLMKNLGAAIQTRFLLPRNNALTLSKPKLETKVIWKDLRVTTCQKHPLKVKKYCKTRHNANLMKIKECSNTRHNTGLMKIKECSNTRHNTGLMETKEYIMALNTNNQSNRWIVVN